MKRNKLVSVDDKPLKNYSYSLEQNYPNPFNNETIINFSLPKEELVKIKVYNILGEEVKELLNTSLLAGEHKINWDGSDAGGKTLASGIYLVTLSSAQYIKTIKTVLLK